MKEDLEKDIKRRAAEVLKECKISVNKLAGAYGISQTTLNDQINGTSKISAATLVALADFRKDLSAEWLLRGVGEMLIMDAEKHVNDTPTTRKRHDNEPERLPDNSGEIDALRETIATQRITIQSLLEQIDLLKKGDSSAQLHSARVG